MFGGLVRQASQFQRSQPLRKIGESGPAFNTAPGNFGFSGKEIVTASDHLRGRERPIRWKGNLRFSLGNRRKSGRMLLPTPRSPAPATGHDRTPRFPRRLHAMPFPPASGGMPPFPACWLRFSPQRAAIAAPAVGRLARCDARWRGSGLSPGCSSGPCARGRRVTANRLRH